MNVFLDLEETVIDNWTSGMLVNSAKVRDWLERLKVRKVFVFSFAVWNEADRDLFWKNMERPLRMALDIGFVRCPTVEEFMKADTKVTGMKWDNMHEFILTRGKVDSFRSWCRLNHPHEHNILLDDVVPNAVWEEFDTGLKLQFVNVKTLT